MIIFRILFIGVLLSNCAAVTMQREYRQKISIDMLLNTVIIPQHYGWLSDLDVVELYLQQGGNINAKGIIYANPIVPVHMREMNLLMTSVLYGRPRLMKFLIQNCAKLDYQNEYGDTALILAARNGKASLVRLLLKKGANPLIRNKYNTTALWQAEHSPFRHLPFFDQEQYTNYSFPRLIKYLKRFEYEHEQRQQESLHIVDRHKQVVDPNNYRVLRIQQH